jgi:HK97 family phage portal protein
MAKASIFSALAEGIRRPAAAKGVTWIRPANVPADAGDGFIYNAPWQEAVRGRAINERSALQLSTVMACVRLLSQTIASMPLSIYKRLPNGDRRAATEHPLYSILHDQPNKDTTAVDFWQVILNGMFLGGTGYARKLMFNGKLVGLRQIPHELVKWEIDSNGEYTFYYQVLGSGRWIKLAPGELLKVPAFTLDGVVGLSPIKWGTRVIGSALAADDASAAVFENGMAASGFVTYDEWLTPEQRKAFKENLQSFSGSAVNAREMMILEKGMKYTPLGMNPEDAQMLGTRGFSVEEICRWFGVPPTLVGHGEKTSNWGTGLEQQNLGFLTYTLTPWLEKIEQNIKKDLMLPGEKVKYFAEFSVDGLLRSDTAARVAKNVSYANAGIITRDEIRKLENLPAMGGNAEILTVQKAMWPLEKLGDPAQETAKPAGDEDPPTDDKPSDDKPPVEDNKP